MRHKEHSYCHGSFHSDLDALRITQLHRDLWPTLLRKSWPYSNPSITFIRTFSSEQRCQSYNIWREIPGVQCGSTADVWLHQQRRTSCSVGISHFCIDDVMVWKSYSLNKLSHIVWIKLTVWEENVKCGNERTFCVVINVQFWRKIPDTTDIYVYTWMPKAIILTIITVRGILLSYNLAVLVQSIWRGVKT